MHIPGRCRSGGAISGYWAPFLASPRPEKAIVTHGLGPLLRNTFESFFLEATMPRAGRAGGRWVEGWIMAFCPGQRVGEGLLAHNRFWGRHKPGKPGGMSLPRPYLTFRARGQFPGGSADPHSWPLGIFSSLSILPSPPKPCPFSPHPPPPTHSCLSAFLFPGKVPIPISQRRRPGWEKVGDRSVMEGVATQGKAPGARDAFPIDISQIIYFKIFFIAFGGEGGGEREREKKNHQ